MIDSLTYLLMAAPAGADGAHTKWLIVVFGNLVFWGILGIIWFASRVVPKWEAKQKARQEELRREREGYMNETDP